MPSPDKLGDFELLIDEEIHQQHLEHISSNNTTSSTSCSMSHKNKHIDRHAVPRWK